MDKDFLERCLGEGMSLPEIGQIVGRPPGTIGYWVRKHGLVANGSTKFRPGKGLQREPLATLVGEGKTLGQIASELEVGFQTVRYWIAKYELPRPHEVRAARTAERLRTGDTRGTRTCRRHGDVEFRDGCAWSLAQNGYTNGIEFARQEATKCVLLCANCHVEVERGLTELPFSRPADR